MTRKFLRLALASAFAGLVQLPASHAGPQAKAPAAKAAAPISAPATSDRVDTALQGGVKFLLTQQNAVGSFSDNPKYHTALTALAAMALVSAGHHPGDRSPEGFALKRAMHFLLRADRQTADGYFGLADHSTMFGHALVTLALTQFLQLDLDRETDASLRAKAQAATILILRAQGVKRANPLETGGWRYYPASTDADLPATAWQLLALSSGEKAGFKIPPASGPAAAGYLKRLFADGFGLFDYGRKPVILNPERWTISSIRTNKTAPGRIVSRTPVVVEGKRCYVCHFSDSKSVTNYFAPTIVPPETLLLPPSEPNHYSHLAEGLVGLRVTGQGRSPEAVQSASMLLDMLQADPQMKFLAHGPWPFHGTFFASLALNGFNEPHSTAVRIFAERNLVHGQSKDGSWTDNFEGRYLGRVYCTSLAVIALGARYGHLPLYGL
ncbi:MAG: hypothetical protein FJ386_13450 [Verrucomicrobia bacterium]|nr:hypothetical protein [Verrucomicrobiota bacterium]